MREIHVSSSSMSKNHSICWFLLWDRKNSIKEFVSERYFHFNLEMKQNPVLLKKKKAKKPQIRPLEKAHPAKPLMPRGLYCCSNARRQMGGIYSRGDFGCNMGTNQVVLLQDNSISFKHFFFAN